MTLINIITRALTALGRHTDAQSMEAWKDKFTMFANDGVRDLAEYLELRRVDDVEVENGMFSTSDLTRGCLKILSVYQNDESCDFTLSTESGYVNVDADDGTVSVNYRYLPKEMENDIDTPDIPETVQHLIVTYVIWREHMTLDPNMQARGNIYLQTYNQSKSKARRNLGETDTYNIYNYGW